jgi:hypothetical protein
MSVCPRHAATSARPGASWRASWGRTFRFRAAGRCGPLLQQPVQEKRLFLAWRGGGIAVRVEPGLRNGVLRCRQRGGRVRGDGSGRRRAQGRRRWLNTGRGSGRRQGGHVRSDRSGRRRAQGRRRWLNTGRPGRQFQRAVAPAGAQTQRRDSGHPQKDYRTAKNQGHPTKTRDSIADGTAKATFCRAGRAPDRYRRRRMDEIERIRLYPNRLPAVQTEGI